MATLLQHLCAMAPQLYPPEGPTQNCSLALLSSLLVSAMPMDMAPMDMCPISLQVLQRTAPGGLLRGKLGLCNGILTMGGLASVLEETPERADRARPCAA